MTDPVDGATERSAHEERESPRDPRTRDDERPETDHRGVGGAIDHPDTLGIDNTDTALSPEDLSTPLE